MVDVYCYSLKTSEEKYLTTVESFNTDNACFSKDGTVYIPLDDMELEKNKNGEINYCVIVGDKVRENIKTEIVYKLGDKSYTIRGYNRNDLYCIDGEKRYSMEEEVAYGEKTLIPCDKGILIHNDGEDNLLYLIDETGNVQSLFEIECMISESSVNVYQNTVFLSFKRFEKHGEFGVLEYENDTIQGTYRIDLNDGSATKISDRMYRGLYIWGEDVIYAVDFDDQIFQLDFEGNVIEELLVKR